MRVHGYLVRFRSEAGGRRRRSTVHRAVTWAAAVATAASVGALAPGTAGADSPDDVGWWSRAQTPSTPPGVAPPPTIPAPPQEVVPEDGLFVAMGPYSDVPDPAQPPPPIAPIAIAALRFTVPEGSEATLSLGLAENYDADGPSQAPHPPFLVDACVPNTDVVPWDPPGGPNGRWEDRAVADCDTFSVPSTSEEDGQRLEWKLPSQFQVTEGVLDVVLVPRGIPDPQDARKTVAVPFALAFAPPDDQALVTEGGVEEEGLIGEDGEQAGFDVTADGEFGVDDFAAGDAFGTEGFGDFSADGAGGGFGDVAATGGNRRQNRFQPAVGVPAIDDRVERVMALSILLALVAGLWWIAGQPVRAPRLLGSVGSGSAPVATVAPTSRGGVGRFARPRNGRPPSLS